MYPQYTAEKELFLRQPWGNSTCGNTSFTAYLAPARVLWYTQLKHTHPSSATLTPWAPRFLAQALCFILVHLDKRQICSKTMGRFILFNLVWSQGSEVCMQGLETKRLQEKQNTIMLAMLPSLRIFAQNIVLGLLITNFHMLPPFSSPHVEYFLLCLFDSFSWRLALQTPLHILSLFAVFRIKCPPTGSYD